MMNMTCSTVIDGIVSSNVYGVIALRFSGVGGSSSVYHNSKRPSLGINIV